MARACAAALAIGAGLAVVPAASVQAVDVIHVAPAGDDSGEGTSISPLRTLSAAVAAASPGDVIELADGTYHEQVQIYAKKVHIRAAAGAEPILDGARPVADWTAEDGLHWAPWSTDFERVGAPFTTVDDPQAGWPEQFFLDGTSLDEVTSVGAVAEGTFFHDRAADRVWMADDPAGRLVEGSDLNWAIYLNLADGSTLDGLTVRRYATQNSNMAAVRAYADDLELRDLTISDNARMGVSVIGDRVRLERIAAVDNGHLGIHAHRSNDLLIESSTVTGNNRERFDPFHSAGGIKVTESDSLLVADSMVSDNAGPGIWTDLDVTDAVIRGNDVENNGRSGIEIELSSNVVVGDNTVRSNGETGIWVLESSEVDVWHNAVHHNVREIWIEDGPRSDVNGVRVLHNLLGGDAGVGAAPAVLSVDDWTEQRAGSDMGIVADANHFWLVPGAATSFVSTWAVWPAPPILSSTDVEHRDISGASSSVVTSAASQPFDGETPMLPTTVQPSPDVEQALVDPGRRPPGPVRILADPETPPAPLPTTQDVVVQDVEQPTAVTPVPATPVPVPLQSADRRSANGGETADQIARRSRPSGSAPHVHRVSDRHDGRENSADAGESIDWESLAEVPWSLLDS